MEKIKNCTELKIGELYSDRDGERVLIYRGRPGYLYAFEATEYDDKGDFFGTGEEIRLTAQEVCELYSLNTITRRTHARKPSAAEKAKREAEKAKREELLAQERKLDEQAFDAFEAADEGVFDGFNMVNTFHRRYDKATAVETLMADDCAEAVTSTGAIIHAGADGVAVYVMTEEARRGDVKKTVIFNRSVYAF